MTVLEERGCVERARSDQGTGRGPGAARGLVELGIPHDGAGARVSAREKHLTVLEQRAVAVIAAATSRCARRGQRSGQREGARGGIVEVGTGDGAACAIPAGEQDFSVRKSRDAVVEPRKRECSGDGPRAADRIVDFRLVQAAVRTGTAVLRPAGQKHPAICEERCRRAASSEIERTGRRPGVRCRIVKFSRRTIGAIRVAPQPGDHQHLSSIQKNRAVARAYAERERGARRPAVGDWIVQLGGVRQSTGTA